MATAKLIDPQADGSVAVIVPAWDEKTIVGLTADEVAGLAPGMGLAEPDYAEWSEAVSLELHGRLGLGPQQYAELHKAVTTFMSPGPGYTDDEVSFTV